MPELILKPFSPLEIIHLLHECAVKLGYAHQSLADETLYQTAIEALKAYDYLLCQLQQEKTAFTIH